MASSPPPKRPRTDGAAQHAAKPKVFNDSILKHIELHPACIAVVDTREFQRLRRLKQLGPTEWVFPGATHQRFAHSIGVSYLAGRLVERLQRNQPDLGIDARDVLCVKLAGLCHDLGHGPLSHTYDGKFVKKAWARRGIESDWCHEHSSAEIFARVVERYGLMRGAFATYGLRDDDVHFVQELIYGLHVRSLARQAAQLHRPVLRRGVHVHACVAGWSGTLFAAGGDARRVLFGCTCVA